MASAETTWFAVEFTNLDGDVVYEVAKTGEALGDFARVNAQDMCSLRVSAVTANVLAHDRIAETFATGRAEGGTDG